MAENPGSNSQQERRRSLSGLLFWLGLLPVVLGSLFCCAQAALLAIPHKDWAVDTRSRLMANYMPWQYQEIPPLRLAELIKDIERDEMKTGTPRAVVTAVYWVPPTPTSTVFSVAAVTGTATSFVQPTTTRTPAATVSNPTQSPTPAISATATIRPPTSTATSQPTNTSTATRTPTVPPQPTSTYTPRPNPTNTYTPVTPSNTPVTPSRTPVTPSATPITPTPVTPSPTPITPTPVTPSPTPITPTPVTPTPIPTYAPVWPIAENDGVSMAVEGGCRASFGYRNDNPQAVDIPVGPRNQISDENAAITPSQPTHFLRDRVSGAFEVVWNSGQEIMWSLDGRLAIAAWCTPAP